MITARLKFLKISPTKLDKIISKLSKKSYFDALEILKNGTYKSSKIFWKLLHSAASNASQNFGIKKVDLYVDELYCTRGPILKRTQAKAKGKATKIEKKFSHITLKLKEKE